MFFENYKKNICFYCFVEFLSKSNILHANSPDREKMLFYQALALQIRGAPIKNAGLSQSFFDFHLKTTVVMRITVSFFRMKICSPDEEQSPESETNLSPDEEDLLIWRMSPIL